MRVRIITKIMTDNKTTTLLAEMFMLLFSVLFAVNCCSMAAYSGRRHSACQTYFLILHIQICYMVKTVHSAIGCDNLGAGQYDLADKTHSLTK